MSIRRMPKSVESEIAMNPKFFIWIILIAGAFYADDLSSQPRHRRCDVMSMEEISREPLVHAGQIFCGYAFAFRHNRDLILSNRRHEIESVNEFSFIVTTETSHRIHGVSNSAQRFYIRAIVDPQRECFIPAESGESCVPYAHPIFMHIISARKYQN